jgi:hypothetical protein
MRSISDSVNSMMKKKLPVKTRKKLSQRKKVEETLKINTHNPRCYIYLKHTDLVILGDYRELQIYPRSVEL